jgi:hypothetical protein
LELWTLQQVLPQCHEGKQTMLEGRHGAYVQPLDVQVYEGEVVVTGPGAVDIALTASAAAETAQRLAAAAASIQSRTTAQAEANASHDSVSED